ARSPRNWKRRAAVQQRSPPRSSASPWTDHAWPPTNRRILTGPAARSPLPPDALVTVPVEIHQAVGQTLGGEGQLGHLRVPVRAKGVNPREHLGGGKPLAPLEVLQGSLKPLEARHALPAPERRDTQPSAEESPGGYLGPKHVLGRQADVGGADGQ